MDGRKLNGGHSTKGLAGRKSKADEIRIIEKMDTVSIPDQIWRALWNKVEEGDIQAIKTWLAYRYGLPKQMVDLSSQGQRLFEVRIINGEENE